MGRQGAAGGVSARRSGLTTCLINSQKCTSTGKYTQNLPAGRGPRNPRKRQENLPPLGEAVRVECLPDQLRADLYVPRAARPYDRIGRPDVRRGARDSQREAE